MAVTISLKCLKVKILRFLLVLIFIQGFAKKPRLTLSLGFLLPQSLKY